jgi:hypothetical protein
MGETLAVGNIMQILSVLMIVPKDIKNGRSLNEFETPQQRDPFNLIQLSEIKSMVRNNPASFPVFLLTVSERCKLSGCTSISPKF